MNIEQLTQKIIDELENSLSNMSGYFDNPHAKISAINARVGQISSSIQSIDDLAEDIFSKENGWIIDFEFQPTLVINPSNSLKDNFETIPTIHWFENLPINAIKGIGFTWQSRFNALDILTIGDLLFINAACIKKITDEYNSAEPIAFKRMCELLDVTLPLSVYKTYSDLALIDLINDSVKFSKNELAIRPQHQLTLDFINNCLLCIDQAFFSRIILKYIGAT